jgi:trans-aconitate 2-methyltransferase
MRSPSSSSSPEDPESDGYSFGDNPTAERRLRLLADVFASTSDSVLARLGGDVTGQVLDLGCGPGLTTWLLARHFPRATVLGLDNSAALLASAGLGGGERRGGREQLGFLEHDVTCMPLPRSPAAVIYARFLLAHLAEPAALVRAWAGELAVGGALVLEEVEWIRTTDEVFAEYLELMAGVLRARQTELYVGPMMGQLGPPAGCTTSYSNVAVLEPTKGQAAGMFSLNFATVRHDRAVGRRRTEADLDVLGDALEARCDDERIGSITWGMRQVVVRRVEPRRDMA